MAFVNRLKKALRKGRTVELPPDEGEAAYMLLSVVMQNQFRQLSELLNNSDFYIDYQFGRGKRTLLHSAASVGAVDCIDVLLRKGANPNKQDMLEVHALYHAARNGHERCVKRLLEAGSDIYCKDTSGLTVLHWLACSGRVTLIASFLDHGASPDAADTQGQTPMHFACQNGHVKAVNLLVERGASCHTVDNSGRTPLYSACKNGQIHCLEILIRHGAVCMPSKDGVHPLDVCIKEGYKECVAMLVKGYPELLNYMLNLVMKEDMPEEQLVGALKAVMAAHIDVESGLPLLETISTKVQQTGMELLSNSSDAAALTQMFLKGVRILCQLYASPLNSTPSPTPTPAAPDSSRLRSSTQRQSSFSLSPPFNSTQLQTKSTSFSFSAACSKADVGPLQTLEPIWLALGSWFDLLAEEVRRTAEEEAAGITTTTPSKPHPQANPQAMPEVAAAIVHSIPPVRRHVYLSEQKAKKKRYRQSLNLERLTVPPMVQRSSSVEATIDMELQEGDTSPPKAEKESTVDVMADRLCAVVHAFALCCQADTRNTALLGGGTLHRRLIVFVETHELVLKVLIARNPTLIFAHFHFLLEYPELLPRFIKIIMRHPFDQRKKWFYDNLYLLKEPENPLLASQREEAITIEREKLFHSSCDAVLGRKASDLKEKLIIQFTGEEGMGTGVQREWFNSLSSEILNPDYALFIQSADGATFQPNSMSHINPDHLNYFRFAGAIMGLAIYHKQLLNVYFTRSFYKHILGVAVNYKDVESIDPEYAKNLQWLLDHEIDSEELDLTFSVETESFGRTKELELKPNGTHIIVTDENKGEYVQLVTEMKLTQAIEAQIRSFLDGFYEVIPQSLISLFDEYELELLLSGLPQIDLADWRANTEYGSEYNAEHPTIKVFWETLETFDHAQLATLLQFVTGSSRVPLGGFSHLVGASGIQKFTITHARYTPDILPSSSTCFNLLKLPEYPSKDILADRLQVALHYGSMGFTFT